MPRDMDAAAFEAFMTEQAKVAVSPGIGFGPFGDEHVRFALVENRMRINQAVRGIRHFLAENGVKSGEVDDAVRSAAL